MPRMIMAIHSRGVTLIELMVAVAVLAIALTTSLPSFVDLLSRHRLKGATEKIYQDLQVARSEAIKRGMEVSVSFRRSGNAWCYGLSLGEGCDCTETDNTAVDYCLIESARKVTLSRDYVGVTLTTISFHRNDTGFEPLRGNSTDNGSAVLVSRGYGTKIVVSGLGRVRICSDDAILGYPPCE